MTVTAPVVVVRTLSDALHLAIRLRELGHEVVSVSDLYTSLARYRRFLTRLIARKMSFAIERAVIRDALRRARARKCPPTIPVLPEAEAIRRVATEELASRALLAPQAVVITDRRHRNGPVLARAEAPVVILDRGSEIGAIASRIGTPAVVTTPRGVSDLRRRYDVQPEPCTSIDAFVPDRDVGACKNEIACYVARTSGVFDPCDVVHNSLFEIIASRVGALPVRPMAEIVSGQIRLAIARASASTIPAPMFLQRPIYRTAIVCDGTTAGPLPWRIGRENASGRSVLFDRVPRAMAAEIHNVFHFVHCARAGISVGLYFSGDDIPFSVLTLSEIDRAYKSEVLVENGIAPEHVAEVSRLYNSARAPKNASSVIVSLATRWAARTRWLRAIITTVMPAFARGRSITNGNFGEVLLTKPLRLSFRRQELDSGVVWQHIVRRHPKYSDTPQVNVVLPPTMRTFVVLRKL